MTVTGRQALPRSKRLVVKLGTGALTRGAGRFDRLHFESLSADLVEAGKNRQLLIVSSGAIALGVERLKLKARPSDIPGKQACAAVGQSSLMRAYEEAFDAKGRVVAQVLLTHEDVQDRRRYLNARHALERLLVEGVVPIINENDTVSVDEIRFGDNDTLAGLVAGLVEADTLVILSDVEALFEADPRKVPGAKRIAEVHEVSPALLARAGGSGTSLGTGGMDTKLKAAGRAREQGIRTVIASGHLPGTLRRVLAGEDVGTLFEPATQRRDARTAWIAHALKPRGKLRVDEGAKKAVVELKRSLLPSGLLEVIGNFSQGDPVDLIDPSGVAFARGLAAYPADELRKIAGKQSGEIEQILGYRYLDDAVHRDDLAILG